MEIKEPTTYLFYAAVPLPQEDHSKASRAEAVRLAHEGAWSLLASSLHILDPERFPGRGAAGFSCRAAAEQAGLPLAQCFFMQPGESLEWEGVRIEAVPAYNVDKAFHTREKGYLGYVAQMLGRRYYIAGDTDDNEAVRQVRCHVALLPVGGTYTMTAAQAADLAGAIRPEIAVPTHYGDIVGERGDGETFASLLDKGILCDIGM